MIASSPSSVSQTTTTQTTSTTILQQQLPTPKTPNKKVNINFESTPQNQRITTATPATPTKQNNGYLKMTPPNSITIDQNNNSIYDCDYHPQQQQMNLTPRYKLQPLRLQYSPNATNSKFSDIFLSIESVHTQTSLNGLNN
jgi:hypothetical protein